MVGLPVEFHGGQTDQVADWEVAEGAPRSRDPTLGHRVEELDPEAVARRLAPERHPTEERQEHRHQQVDKQEDERLEGLEHCLDRQTVQTGEVGAVL